MTQDWTMGGLSLLSMLSLTCFLYHALWCFFPFVSKNSSSNCFLHFSFPRTWTCHLLPDDLSLFPSRVVCWLVSPWLEDQMAIAGHLLISQCPLPTAGHLFSFIFLFVFIKLYPMLRLPADQRVWWMVRNAVRTKLLPPAGPCRSIEDRPAVRAAQDCPTDAATAARFASCISTQWISRLDRSVYAPFHLLKVSAAPCSYLHFCFLILKASFWAQLLRTPSWAF